jgi:putative sterol carrier protein
MTEPQATDPGTSFPSWVDALPHLADFATPLPSLVEADRNDVHATFERLSELLGASETPFALQIQIGDEEQPRIWTLAATADGCRLTDINESADIEALLGMETWALLASGALSPLEAFARGQMRVRGDLRAARRLARQLYRSEMLES